MALECPAPLACGSLRSKNDMKKRNMNESRADKGPSHEVPLGNVDFDHSKQGCYNEGISALT